MTEDELSIFLTLRDTKYKQLIQEVLNFSLGKVTSPAFSPISTQEKDCSLDLLYSFLTAPLNSPSWNMVSNPAQHTDQNPLNNVQVLLEILSFCVSGGVYRSGLSLAVLENILALFKTSESHQEAFTKAQGINITLRFFARNDAPREFRIKCMELIAYILKHFPSSETDTTTQNEKPAEPKADDATRILETLLGMETVLALMDDSDTPVNNEVFIDNLAKKLANTFPST
eukprot:CAMPEP_0168541974 /NCGR_PEP_ID=MMETSP0413-20121227/1101_1 /TAXON_ID=136452 /ORGANISM="Filamoeba nolandi, Strain NC-AS-23-1" /LENGTH=228 /DNA_ID=CAMNT_0008571821 /DNA_START=117 /DNA_END=803 /DNA_ORIENTATION=-